MSRATEVKRFVAAVAKAAPRQAAGSAILLILSSLMEGVGVLLLVPLLALVGVDTGGSLGQLVDRFSAVFAAIGIQPTLASVLAVYVALNALQSLLQRWQASFDSAVQYAFIQGLRGRVYRSIAGARWEFLARRRSSDALHILTKEIDRVRSAAYYLTNLLVASIVALVYLVIALRVSTAITSIVIACGILLGLSVRGKIAGARVLGEAWSASSQRIFSVMTEHIASMKTAKSYGIAGRHADDFERLSQEEHAVQLQTTRTVAAMRQRLAIGVPLVLAVVVYVSYGMLRVSTAQLLLLLFMFARLIPRLTGLYENIQVFAVTFPAYEGLVAFESQCLQARESVADQHAPLTLVDRVRFDRVTFAYREDGSSPAVSEVTLEVPAGRTTAVVGASGAGKSTIVDLLTGLLEPSSGRILIDNVPLDPLHLLAWRNQIALVPQETFLFHDSVRGNLLWTAPGASDEELWHALRAAAAFDFVKALPEGLDTIVGDRGVLVSGGERQRLALARALVRRPRVLLLDEATSSLDSENEARIQDAIDRLHQQITIIVITHRLSTVRHADLIHVLDQGRLVESGSWDELASRPTGRFRELCQAQGLEAALLPVLR